MTRAANTFSRPFATPLCPGGQKSDSVEHHSPNETICNLAEDAVSQNGLEIVDNRLRLEIARGGRAAIGELGAGAIGLPNCTGGHSTVEIAIGDERDTHTASPKSVNTSEPRPRWEQLVGDKQLTLGHLAEFRLRGSHPLQQRLGPKGIKPIGDPISRFRTFTHFAVGLIFEGPFKRLTEEKGAR